ncbi:MAG: metallophosphoesterase family protein [Lachnospiraceae bacterium]|nr:metallophosphoesterase family protein [Lachnospiraceae bacterium]
MRYYIADLHFCHESLNERMDKRGFSSAEAMNEYMIRQWNSRVRNGDDVVILGDFCISPKGEVANEILARLNGRKSLIIGNHDKFIESKTFRQEHFKWVRNYEELNDEKRKVILSHYPIMCYNGQYRLGKDGTPKTYMLYGHVHNSYDEILVNDFQEMTRSRQRAILGTDDVVSIPCQMINCFCMFSDYVPLTLDEWIKVDEERRRKLQGLSNVAQ